MKQEILKELETTGNISVFRESPAWRKAFEAYKVANPGSHKHFGCGSCYRDVLSWLRK